MNSACLRMTRVPLVKQCCRWSDFASFICREGTLDMTRRPLQPELERLSVVGCDQVLFWTVVGHAWAVGERHDLDGCWIPANHSVICSATECCDVSYCYLPGSLQGQPIGQAQRDVQLFVLALLLCRTRQVSARIALACVQVYMLSQWGQGILGA